MTTTTATAADKGIGKGNGVGGGDDDDDSDNDTTAKQNSIQKYFLPRARFELAFHLKFNKSTK